MITARHAAKARTEHRFLPGVGYVRVEPLTMPPAPAGPAKDCEPVAPANAGTLHFLRPPQAGAQPVPMLWHPKEREWAHQHPGHGNRVGFSSAYLAAHGWRYLGQAA